MSKTFAQLGIPFPLFDAPAEDSQEYAGLNTCCFCTKTGKHCFRLGIGADLLLDCPQCGTINGIRADERKAVNCKSCVETVHWPFPGTQKLFICHDCLRQGRAALTKGTVLGMVTWELSLQGVTHGRPGLKSNDFELVATASDWVRAKVPQEFLRELLRTPTYSTIQEDQWQFCCGRPMVFIGRWEREHFNRAAADGDGRKLFCTIVQDVMEGLWEEELHDETGIYVFKCTQCNRMTAHWDLA
ncbi:MAG: hypothetical protein JWR26_4251 [Pedosphaera sp.]|nr:hypothetical protein [Pedosphaera sp.]